MFTVLCYIYPKKSTHKWSCAVQTMLFKGHLYNLTLKSKQHPLLGTAGDTSTNSPLTLLSYPQRKDT